MGKRREKIYSRENKGLFRGEKNTKIIPLRLRCKLISRVENEPLMPLQS